MHLKQRHFEIPIAFIVAVIGTFCIAPTRNMGWNIIIWSVLMPGGYGLPMLIQALISRRKGYKDRGDKFIKTSIFLSVGAIIAAGLYYMLKDGGY
jgi:hypothetical protein